jgi:threonylcarbamoyladenosine tRNA methylthiotransferase MtaB
VGRYDSEGVGLPEVLRRVDDTGVTRWRLTSIEPVHVTDGLTEALSAAAHMCPHVHVPLQSGSDEVLSAMGRGYTAAAYERAVARLREAVPGLVVTTDVMVGFPGEGEDDLSRTVELCERVGFAKLHVFRFSARPGTAAVDIPGALSPQVKAVRSRRLQQLGDRLRDDYMLSRVGQRADVLVERVDGVRAEGTTEDYLKVEMSSGGLRVGTLHQVTLGVPAAGRMSAAC